MTILTSEFWYQYIDGATIVCVIAVGAVFLVALLWLLFGLSVMLMKKCFGKDFFG